MASPEIELEQQLKETGNMLNQHSLSVDELLPLLDQVENFLSRVEQSPPKSMLDALSPSMKALVEDALLRHSDVDVKVAVASCISEITRITAPDAPYDDDKMKDVFQLIVSSFENLSEQSSRSYNKRASILETVAKVRSCVVMLDLECDGLIVEMFQHFLKSVRDYHPENVFSSMETIMTLVLEESEDITLEILSPILASVKKNNEGVLPVARKLGERVLEKSADRLRPYMAQTLKSLGVSLDDYSQVVASICEGTTGAVEHNDENASGQQLADEIRLAKASSDEAAQADESKLTTASSEETAEVVKEIVTERPCPEEVDPAADRSPKSVMSNGNMVAGNEEPSVDQESSKKPEQGQLADQSDVILTSKIDTDDSDAGKLVKSASKPEQTAKRRGRKSNTKINTAEPSDSSHVDSEKEAEKLPDHRKSRSKDVHDSSGKDPSMEEAMPSENEKDIDVPVSSPKAIESEAPNAAPSSPSGSLPDESRIKKAGRSKKKQNSIQEDASSRDVVSTKASAGMSDSEVKSQKRTGKKALTKVIKEDKILATVGTSKNEGGTTSDSEAKPLKQLGKKVDLVDSRAKQVKKSGKKVDASDLEVKALKQSGKKVDAGDADAKPLKQSVKKGDGSDSEAKPLRQSGKKGDISGSETKPLRQTVKKGEESDSDAKLLNQSAKRGNARKSGEESDSDTKLLKLSAKRGNARNSGEDKSSSKKKEDGKRQGRGKNVTEKDLAKSLTEDDEMVTPPKSTTKSAKDEDHLEEPTTNSKRKRTAGKEKQTPEAIKYDESLIGSKVKVWWPKDRMYYEGVIQSFDPAKTKHKVVYNDGDQEILNLKMQKWEFVQDDSEQDGDQATEDQSPDGSSETHKKKKAKTDSGPSPAHAKVEISPKRGGAASSKLKRMTFKSGGKSKDKDAGKLETKSKDSMSKSSGKPDDDNSGKAKDKTQKSSGKSVDGGATPKTAGKSKEVDTDTPKTTTNKTTPKIVTKSKGKTAPSGNKANANGSSKVKSSLSNVKEKESEDSKGKSPEAAVKGKSESGTKSGKKRKKRS